jgi:hypothetical protein
MLWRRLRKCIRRDWRIVLGVDELHLEGLGFWRHCWGCIRWSWEYDRLYKETFIGGEISDEIEGIGTGQVPEYILFFSLPSCVEIYLFHKSC